MTVGDVIQIAAILVAAGASIVALIIASKDRRNAIKIAEDDRQAAADQARLSPARVLLTQEYAAIEARR